MPARMINKEELLNAFKSDYGTYKDLAQKFGCAVETIKYWRGVFKKSGDLTTDARLKVGSTTQPKKSTPDCQLANITPKQLDELMLHMYERALKYPTLEEENYRLKNVVAAKEDVIKQLDAELQETRDKANRIEAIKKGLTVVHGD